MSASVLDLVVKHLVGLIARLITVDRDGVMALLQTIQFMVR